MYPVLKHKTFPNHWPQTHSENIKTRKKKLLKQTKKKNIFPIKNRSTFFSLFFLTQISKSLISFSQQNHFFFSKLCLSFSFRFLFLVFFFFSPLFSFSLQIVLSGVPKVGSSVAAMTIYLKFAYLLFHMNFAWNRFDSFIDFLSYFFFFISKFPNES